MPTENQLVRSPELMSADDTGLLVVDVQGKLIQLIDGHGRLVWNMRRLIEGAKLQGLPVVATEQYPKGLGPTAPELQPLLETVLDKTAFSCAGCAGFGERLQKLGRRKWLVCGIEAHVCIQQTVLDMMANGYRVYLAVDAIGSRFPIDCEIALRRLESSGATLTTVEAALFEWCVDSKSPQFKQLSQLVRQTQP